MVIIVLCYTHIIVNIRLEEAQARSNTETRHCRKYSQVQVPEPRLVNTFTKLKETKEREWHNHRICQMLKATGSI